MDSGTSVLLNLPWNIQIALASGYAAYLLGYRGVRAAHKAIDIAFITLVFGLVATGVIVLLAITSFSLRLRHFLPRVLPPFFGECFLAGGYMH